MTKKEIKKFKKAILKVTDIEEKRNICQEFNDLIKRSYNFKLLSDEDVISSFEQIKEVIKNV